VIRWDLTNTEKPTVHSEISLQQIPAVSPTVGFGKSGTDTMLELDSSDTLRIEAPADIQTLKTEDPELAARWRQVTREAFIHCLDAGYAVSEFRVNPEGSGGWYILTNQRRGDG
jgi:predicted GNAT superfamily acetyltransferase